MTTEIKEPSTPPQTGIRQELIDNIQKLARLDPPVREALFGSLTDHLVRVCRGRFPTRLDVVHEIARLGQLRELGVAENIIWHSLLASDSYYAATIRQQVPVDELRIDPPGALWSMFLEATSEQVPELAGLESRKRMSTETLGRAFLRNIDSTWAGGSSWRLPSSDDWLRYKSYRDLAPSETGLPFGAIRHLELTGARVVINYYASKLNWGSEEIRNFTNQFAQELQVES